MTERRAEEREPAVVLLRYYDSSLIEGQLVTFLNYAITVDVSESGISFRSYKSFGAERPLRLVSYDLWDTPREGVVRWCSEASPGVYTVGVALADSSAGT